MDQPGRLQALVNALRDRVGMGAQQSPGPATDVAGSYRRYVMDAAERGEQPLSLQEWQNSVVPGIVPASSPR